MRRSPVMRPLLLTVLCGLGALALASQDKQGNDPPAKKGRIQGRVELSLPGVPFRKLGPIVVYLEALEGRLTYDVPKVVPTLTQKNARFSPSLLVIAAGQSVRMPNQDKILHNVFSFSRSKTFDLGLYRKGEEKTVLFSKPGVVPIYCSIHASMNATIYVAPSPYTAIVDRAGRFSIGDVPPGRYRLGTWCQKLPAMKRTVDVRADEATSVELIFGE